MIREGYPVPSGTQEQYLFEESMAPRSDASRLHSKHDWTVQRLCQELWCKHRCEKWQQTSQVRAESRARIKSGHAVMLKQKSSTVRANCCVLPQHCARNR